MALRLTMEWLGACSGCEIAFLNMGEGLLDLLAGGLEIVHAPLLMDHKYCGQGGEGKGLELPEADIALVSGGVADDKHLEVLREVRARSAMVVALGTCATHGGIPALMNEFEARAGREEVFSTPTTYPEGEVPDREVPAPLERVYACDEQVEVDLLLPGCPPHPSLIAELIGARLAARTPRLPSRSVCDTCPVERRGKGEVREAKRFLANCRYQAEEPLSSMRCLLEQGYMCMGPVTLAGCAGGGAPRCIEARVPCRGCYGPVRREGNQMLDMMNAMASNRMNYKSVVDRRSLLRFSGAHGRLRPRLKKSGK